MQVDKKAVEILGLLSSRGQVISVAESCTGGLLANAFVSISGASEVFVGGFLCYSAKSKIEVAGVLESSATENEAVNENCSREFAKSSLDKFASDYAISTTGFAEDGKEMYLSIATKNGDIKTFRKIFFGNRNEIRQAQVEFALSTFWEELLKIGFN
ncbi:MAG: CinA family protein [Opitutales bacterium]